ncbi:MAG: thioredoxin [Bacteroidaceae bacterium]|nr:thioredoxin [Bacteroidaceae bacterium]
MACGGNKAQNSECGECKTECCGNKQECDKKCDKQDCEKKCDKQQCDKQCENKCSKQECDKKCDKQECGAEKKCAKQECEKKCDKQECGAEKKCAKQECEKKCDKQVCTEQAAGCIHLDTDGFTSKVADLSKEWKYLGDKPAVVDFYADWCGPCKAISPILEEIAKEYAGELYIYKINVDNDPYIADAFNIQAIPTLLFIPMEGRYKVQTGGVSKEELVNMIKENCFK